MSDQTTNAMDGGFGKFVPGFEFLQKLAGGAGMTQSLPQMPGLGSWVAPTYNVEDIEKRIEELKAVQFWLDQNGKALAATIQALEVQKMTLATLKTMNLSMGDVAQSLGAMVGLGGNTGSPDEAPAKTPFAGLEIPPRTYGNPTAAPEAEAPPASADEAASAGAAGVIDPMHWWGALTQQFQQIANTALQDASRQLAPGLGDTSAEGGAGGAGASGGASRAKPAKAASATRQPASQRTPAKKAPSRQRKAAAAQPMGAGDWTMPTAFFQMPGFPGMGEPAKKKRAAPASASTSTGRSTPGTPTKSRPAAKKSAPSKATPGSRRR